PWAEAEGLLTIERGEVLEAHRFHLKGSATAVKIPIIGDYTPNLYVSVTLFKGRTAPPKAGLPDDPGRPQVKSGTVELKVPPKESDRDGGGRGKGRCGRSVRTGGGRRRGQGRQRPVDPLRFPHPRGLGGNPAARCERQSLKVIQAARIALQLSHHGGGGKRRR